MSSATTPAGNRSAKFGAMMQAPALVAAKPAQGEPRQRNEPREEAVIGLGDHVPSFLLRPVRVGRS